MSKENFKMFVRSHPELVHYVTNNQMSWQKFYELYDMYGENNSIWQSYFSSSRVNPTPEQQSPKTTASTVGDTSLKDLFNLVKQMDLETVRKGVDGLSKAVALVQDLTTNKKQNNYQARPLYKHLED